MNDTVATKVQDTPTSATSSELAVVIGTRTVEYHQGQRSYTAPTGRTYDRSRPKRSERQKPLAKRPKLGGITKKGNRYLRKMLVVGCTSVLRVAHKYKGALAEWIVAMRARKPERVVAVALANKLARIAWAMMTTGESFRTELYTKA